MPPIAPRSPITMHGSSAWRSSRLTPECSTSPQYGGGRRMNRGKHRLVLHGVALVDELAWQEDARETAVSVKDRPPGWG